MNYLILFAILIISPAAYSAAIVKVNTNQKTITIRANIVFYGKEASDQVVGACAQDIIQEWAPISNNQYVELGIKNNVPEGKYKINLDITYEKMSERKANKEIDNRVKFENNYIEIPRDPMEDSMNAGGNVYNDGFTGSIYADATRVPFKICAHEFGHLLGLGEFNSQDNLPSLMTQSGIKTPYPEFQVKVYDPHFFSMDVGTFDVRLRKLGPIEIREIKRSLQFLNFKNGIDYLRCNTCGY